jgi:hypothetical protein
MLRLSRRAQGFFPKTDLNQGLAEQAVSEEEITEID